VRHFATPGFWKAFGALPSPVQEVAKRNFALLQANPHHPSLHLKQIGGLWSARVGLNYRVLGTDVDADIVWFWIGSHAEYDRQLKRGL
jgi:hypothetical protein